MTKLILGIIIGAVIVWLLMKRKTPTHPSHKATEDFGLINPRQIEEKQKNLDKVLEMARAKGKVSNDDVQYTLGISDRTATRYLEELESQGKIQQVGRTGKSVIYRPL